MPNRIPALLEPYTRLPPEHSLTLISSVLGASANWLVLQCLSGVYGAGAKTRNANDDGVEEGSKAVGDDDTLVVLVSFMWDWEFWTSEAKRTVGLDLRQLQHKGRFAFIDGLSQLFLPSSTNVSSSDSADRGKQTSPASTRQTPSQAHPNKSTGDGAKPSSITYLNTPTPADLKSTVLSIVTTLASQYPSSKVFLVLDNPHILLQTASPTAPITSVDFLSTILQVRSQVHSAIITVPADDAFLAPAAALDLYQPAAQHGTTGFMPLETETASFVMGLVHQSRCVMACRRLETGWADDVSGVLRITGGAGRFDGEEGEGDGKVEGGDAGKVEEGEWLYHIKPDGNVKVWSRGVNA